LVKADRIGHILCIRQIKFIAKYFFLEEVLFLAMVILDLDKYILPW
jgi:hypothetical protein